jgi:hypothetical protein
MIMALPTSTKRLVTALEAEHSPKLAAVLRRAKRNEFNDFLSESATPCIDLVMALEKAGFRALANRARNGEFDATKEESDAWAKSDEGRLTFAELTGGLMADDDKE